MESADKKVRTFLGTAPKSFNTSLLFYFFYTTFDIIMEKQNSTIAAKFKTDGPKITKKYFVISKTREVLLARFPGNPR